MATSFQEIKKFYSGIRFRLSMVYALIFGAGLLILTLFTYGKYLDLAHEEFDQSVRNFALDLSTFLKSDPQSIQNFETIIDREIRYFPFIIHDTAVAIRNGSGKILYTNRGDVEIPFNPKLAEQKDYHERMMNISTGGGEQLRGINLKVTSQGQDLILQVAYASERLIQERNRQFLFLLIIIPLTILVTFFTSILVAGQALTPIRQTVQRVQEMVNTENYLPLPVPKTHDEIAELSRSYNELLLKIKHTLEAQDQFVAHASHQLKTPLAIMRGELEVFQSKARSAEELERFHHSLSQELNRLTQLVRDMLLISRVEAGREHFNFSALALDEVVTETVARLNLKAKDKHITLKFNFDSVDDDSHDPFKIFGERQLLTCLVENIIENAIKYSPPQSSVQITLKSGSYPTLVVSDEGPGVPPIVLDRFKNGERFFRGSHSSAVAGSGLGLYLVKKIAEYHRAKVVIEKRIPSPGTRFVVEFG